VAHLLSAAQIYSHINQIRKNSPLVHNITNFVAMNFSANVLLACGASPLMAHAPEELEEILNIAQALVVNIGTLDKNFVTSIGQAIHHATKKNVPVVLDPVGAGATSLRTETTKKLVRTGGVSVIRGNASEILSLVNKNTKSKGVDTNHSSEEALIAAQDLASTHNLVVCVSGKVDFVVGKKSIVQIYNGDPMMMRVTAMGCVASALIGAFLAIEADYFSATQSAMALMGIAGELAASKANGPGSFQMHFLDAVFQINISTVESHLRMKLI